MQQIKSIIKAPAHENVSDIIKATGYIILALLACMVKLVFFIVRVGCKVLSRLFSFTSKGTAWVAKTI